MISALEQLLLPAECLTCHALLGGRDSQTVVCAVCRGRWRPVRPPWCARCGQPEPHFGPCRLCVDWPQALVSVRSAVWLDDGARRAVHALKYDGLARSADDLAAAMPQMPFTTDGPSAVALVPIPLAPKRLRQRGYNQSLVFARALARRWQRPVWEMLVRVRETPTQTTLTPETRLANVREAFAVARAQRSRISDHWTLIIVDDVFTTGATIAEAASALAQAGATTLHGVTFARAAIPDFH